MVSEICVKGFRVLVTGASGGIGRVLVRELIHTLTGETYEGV